MPCADGGEDPDAIDEGVEIEAEVQRAATDPGQPTQSERERSMTSLTSHSGRGAWHVYEAERKMRRAERSRHYSLSPYCLA